MSSPALHACIRCVARERERSVDCQLLAHASEYPPTSSAQTLRRRLLRTRCLHSRLSSTALIITVSTPTTTQVAMYLPIQRFDHPDTKSACRNTRASKNTPRRFGTHCRIKTAGIIATAMAIARDSDARWVGHTKMATRKSVTKANKAIMYATASLRVRKI